MVCGIEHAVLQTHQTHTKHTPMSPPHTRSYIHHTQSYIHPTQSISLGCHIISDEYPDQYTLTEIQPLILARRNFPPLLSKRMVSPGYREAPDPSYRMAIVFIKVRACLWGVGGFAHVWVCMYGCVCMGVYVWVCMCGCVCMGVYVWVCMCGCPPRRCICLGYIFLF